VAYPDGTLGTNTSGHSEPGQTYNRALVKTLIEKKTHHEYLNKFYFKKLVGADGSGAPIIKKDNFKKDKGDTFRMHMLPQLTGSGKPGDLTLIQSEESVIPYYVDMYINQLRHAVRSDGRMSDQRGEIDFIQEARPLLTNWVAKQLEVNMIRTAINGWPAFIQCSTTYGGLNVNSAAPRPARYWYIAGGNDPTHSATDATYVNNVAAGETALENVETDWLKPTDLEFLAYKARTLNIPPIQTLGMRGGYVLLVHPNQTYQLRKNSTWFNAMQNAGPRDEKGNLIFAGVGADGYVLSYAGIHVFESNEILNSQPSALYTDDAQIDDAADTNVYRAIMLGGNAIAWSEAKTPFFTTEDIDYANQTGVAINTMFGMGRTDYKSDDSNATIYARNLIVYSTYSPEGTTA